MEVPEITELLARASEKFSSILSFIEGISVPEAGFKLVNEGVVPSVVKLRMIVADCNALPDKSVIPDV